jgi:hypothetical protein
MADLVVSVTESITLNNSQQGASNSKTISSIAEVQKRIVVCPASNTTTLATFKANSYDAAAAFDLQGVKYIRVTNLDGTNGLELALVGAAGSTPGTAQIALAAGESFILGSPDDLFLTEADSSPSFGTMLDLDTIQANPGGNAITVEVFIASA